MAKIRPASSLADLLKGSDHAVLLAPVSSLTTDLFQLVFRGKTAQLATELVKGVEPGPVGKVATTLTGAITPPRLTVGVLPSGVSRHLSPSRNLAIDNCLGKVEMEPGSSVAILVVVDDPADVVAAANAVGRRFPLFDGKGKKSKSVRVSFLALLPDGQVIPPEREVSLSVETARWAAQLVDTPTADMTTAGFVEATAQACKSLKSVAMSVIADEELLEAGLGGLHAVGRTAMVGPRLMVLRYEPTVGAEDGPHVALVGKGLVYDTGGLSLKVGGAMPGMKSDMGGAAAVTGAFLVLARLKHPRRLTCVVALAENAIGPNAYRPDDILKMHSGLTVEVNNTDAEGRIVLGDAVSYSVRELKADCVIDAATLTGAQLVATGKRHAAVISNREGLERLAVEAGALSGDTVAPLPFAPEIFQAEFKSAVADMLNSVVDRMNAQASCAAQFIWAHIADTQVPWLHCDLAGPAKPGPRATGFGVALFVELLKRLEASHLKD